LPRVEKWKDKGKFTVDKKFSTLYKWRRTTINKPPDTGDGRGFLDEIGLFLQLDQK
jgi:hypothetical protein